jgi:hypothetical protein
VNSGNKRRFSPKEGESGRAVAAGKVCVHACQCTYM